VAELADAWDLGFGFWPFHSGFPRFKNMNETPDIIGYYA